MAVKSSYDIRRRQGLQFSGRQPRPPPLRTRINAKILASYGFPARKPKNRGKQVLEHACKMASSDSDMRRILESVGVENSVISNFEAQDIITEVVPTLSGAQLQLWRITPSICITLHIILSLRAIMLSIIQRMMMMMMMSYTALSSRQLKQNRWISGLFIVIKG